MSRHLILLLAAALAVATLSPPAMASDTCQRATGGKCKTGQTANKAKPSPGTVTHKKTAAPRHGTYKGRDAFSPAEREKLMARAREICRKEFDQPSQVYRIDYKQGRVWCTPSSY